MSGHDDFWDNLTKEADLSSGGTGSIDSYLSGKPLEGESFTSMRGLTEQARAKNALELPVEAGVRVSFAANLGAVLAYPNPPDLNSQGTVVAVRSANGDVTHHEGMVFVKWDDGEFRSIHAEHLRRAKGIRRQGGMPNRIRVASLGDISDFLKVADDTLIHRSTKDLWSFRQDGSDYVIERLFDATGEPLKG